MQIALTNDLYLGLLFGKWQTFTCNSLFGSLSILRKTPEKPLATKAFRYKFYFQNSRAQAKGEFLRLQSMTLYLKFFLAWYYLEVHNNDIARDILPNLINISRVCSIIKLSIGQHNTIHTKSPVLAASLSAILPGAGRCKQITLPMDCKPLWLTQLRSTPHILFT
jgi:hypothetical protein